MKRKDFLQLFAAETNTTVTTDLEPAISIDIATGLAANINELQQLLGITTLIPMAAGTLIKLYALSVDNTPAQVAEGETIGLTKVSRKLANQIELKLNKYRRKTTAEAIQKVGQAMALNETDEKLITSIRSDIKKSFYTALATGTKTASGTNLQTALAATWGAIQTRFEDEDATPIYFVSTEDIADYLGTAQISIQEAFGFNYVENFLGLGTVVITPALTKGTLYGTAKENLRGAYVPINGGDVANAFALTSDTTGLIGMTHQAQSGNATIETLIMSGVTFFPEFVDGVVKTTISAAGA